LVEGSLFSTDVGTRWVDNLGNIQNSQSDGGSRYAVELFVRHVVQ